MVLLGACEYEFAITPINKKKLSAVFNATKEILLEPV
jgi:hypothetical protein